MDSAEQFFSIDHFEEKFVTYSPVLKKANHKQEISDSETVRDEGAEGTGEKSKEEMESNVSKIGEMVSQDKSMTNILPNEAESPQEVAKGKVEIIMGVSQTVEVDLLAKETDQQTNAQDLVPGSVQKSELNQFISSEDSSISQHSGISSTDKDVRSGIESELVTEEVGLLADKEQILDVSVGWKEVKPDDMMDEQYQQPASCKSVVVNAPPMIISEMATEELSMKPSIEEVVVKEDQVETEIQNTVFKSELEKPVEPADIETQQEVETGCKYDFVFVEKQDADEIMEDRAVTTTAALPCHSIKVERKFHATDFDENKLFEANGKLASEVSFEDIYFDTSSYDLILKDYWLRQRNQKWEFKIPVNKDPNVLYKSSQYQEFDNKKDIRMALLGIIKPEKEFLETEDIMEEFKIEPFATFNTTKKSYQLPFNCKVVIDLTGFGYSVGEIEMMVNDNSEIAEAVEKIDTLAGQLGFQMLSIMKLAKC